MIKVIQTKLHDPDNGVCGNCYSACLASLLEKPITDVPEFDTFKPNWIELRDRYLRLLNLATFSIPNEVRFDGFSIGCGTSPRHGGIHHCVIYRGNKLYHDPHPDGKGLVELSHREILVPYNLKR